MKNKIEVFGIKFMVFLFVFIVGYFFNQVSVHAQVISQGNCSEVNPYPQYCVQAVCAVQNNNQTGCLNIKNGAGTNCCTFTSNASQVPLVSGNCVDTSPLPQYCVQGNCQQSNNNQVGCQNIKNGAGASCCKYVTASDARDAAVQAGVSVCGAKSVEECLSFQGCFVHKNKCYAVADPMICSDLTPTECAGKTLCQISNGICTTLTQAAIDTQYGKPAGASDGLNIIPDCAYSGNCRDVNDLVMVGVNGAKAVFKYIAAIALVMFVYGGFKIILSFGSADKVKSGRDVMIAAVIGMAIAFSAYLLVNSLLTALNVSSEFRIIK